MNRKVAIANLEDLEKLAADLATRLQSHPQFCLYLEGEMGAGKTTFARLLVAALGSDESASPSYAIHNSYVTQAGNVEHFDLFRLESLDDLESTGFWEIFYSGARFILIEWPERLKEFVVQDRVPRAWKTATLKIGFSGESVGTTENSREVEISGL